MPPAEIPDEGNVGIDPAKYPNLRVAGEPNDSFDEPLAVILNTADQGRLQGSISTASDVDVFDVGPMSAGDRLIVDVSSTGGLDAAVAVFDEGGRILFENDDRNTTPVQLDPYANQVIRADTSACFVAIARAPLSASSRIGRYEILLTLTRDGQVPPAEGQTVVLNFAGGQVAIPGDDTYQVGPFNAADISPLYAGLTAAIRQQVVKTIQENYEGLNLNLLVLPGDTVPAGCGASTVYFGERNDFAFGISQTIDTYNADRCDDAIVFTGSFTPGQFDAVLTSVQLGTAIGNVAAHEIGHLLGLNHVADPRDLMDTTGDAGTLLDDQEFMQSVLDDSIFPIGSQDGWLLLLWTLGLVPT